MENVDLELAVDKKKIIIDNTFEGLMSRLEKTEIPTNKFSPSIYKAPSTLRRHSPSSFDPRVVSIGPLHSKDENVQAFEEQKVSFVFGLLKRCLISPANTLVECVKKVVGSIEQIRGCYAGINNEHYSDTELAIMMVMDACFILEFIYWRSESDESVPLNMLLAQSITYDLVLLENQIPFFVLSQVFECTVLVFEQRISLIQFILPVLMILNLFDMNIKISNLLSDTPPHHILGLLHKCYQPRFYILTYFSSSTIHSAVELDRAGVSFKPNRDAKWPMAMDVESSKAPCLPWTLGKPTISMPVLRIHYFTELVFRNLIAYEQSSLGNYNYVTSYAIAMDKIINTHEDVAKLVESKVLVNHMGSHEEAANMINSICKDVAWVDFSPDEHWKRLDKYCNDYWPKNIARLKRTYFSTPWSMIALIAGTMVFFLTLIQTLFTIKPAGSKR